MRLARRRSVLVHHLRHPSPIWVASETVPPEPRTSEPHLGELLAEAKDLVVDMMRERIRAAGHGDIRPSHGCVFRFIDPEAGSRLTDLAERARMTKQAVAEVISELESLDYVRRTPDPTDGRAKIVRLTRRGLEARLAARAAFAAAEAELADRVGGERIAELRETLELVASSHHPAAAPTA